MSALANKFPAMPQVLEERAAFARKHLESGKVKPGPTRFPIVVDEETRVWLECQAYALNTSLAAVAGMILRSVAQQDVRPGAKSKRR